MAQNIYDDQQFFSAYSQLARSVKGLDGAAEWPALCAMLPDLAGKRVVDLGCGFGWFCRWAIASGAASVLGIDLSEKMLARAATEVPTTGITYERHDLDCLRLPEAGWDLAYSSLTLHYLADLGLFIERVRDSLVAGGDFVFSVEHPIYTAPSRPEFVIDAAGAETWPLDKYSIEGPRTTDWLAPGVVKHHRTVATYLAHLFRAGFVLTGLVEWAPTAEQIAEVPAWAIELERPPFLLISARRT